MISAVCDSTGFTITVDETCRAASYSWIDWTSTFVDGVITEVEMPAAAGATCLVDTAASAAATAWTYTVAFTECNIASPLTDTTADGNGILWHTYSLYLNYDNVIATAQGYGNLQQLDQTLVECRIPANLQENAVSGTITITDTDLIQDESSYVDLWSKLQLDVLSGGFGTTAVYSSALAPGESIGLGENVKLQINDVASGTVTQDYK